MKLEMSVSVTVFIRIVTFSLKKDEKLLDFIMPALTQT